MGGVRCLDGSYLTVTPVPFRDGDGVPYEVTLELHRDGVPYGTVGERCGWLLAGLAGGGAGTRGGGRWTASGGDLSGLPGLPGLPDDEELFVLRYRTRGEIVGGGELRCRLRTVAIWVPGWRGARGRWRLDARAFLETRDRGRAGMRAVLTSAELGAFMGALVAEARECLGPQKSGNLSRTPIEGARRSPGRR